MAIESETIGIEAAGLSSAEVSARVARGETNAVPTGPSRTTAQIVRSNIVTRFNILLGSLLAVILVVAPINDALFGIVLVVNAAIGIVQELRAKRTLDELALVNAPVVTVIRNGAAIDVLNEQVVIDEVIELHSGDQVVVDGSVVDSQHLEINEALLTGESEPIVKQPGDEVLSGSFVVAGSGRFQATKVGADSYAVQLAEEARKFTVVRSELRRGVDLILAAVSWLILPTIVLLAWSQTRADQTIREALRAGVAAAVGMVPQGLVLLTSIAFAVGVIRLARRNVLVQELPAVEGLARVDTICFDKTGTLTEGRLVVQRIEVASDHSIETPLRALAGLDERPNGTMRAIAEHLGSDGSWVATTVVPFSSDRKWSGATFEGAGSWVLGAPDVVAPHEHEFRGLVDDAVVAGNRVVVLAHSDVTLAAETLPGGLTVRGVVVLGDTVRPDAADTVRYFAAQGIATKVISGDHPSTVAAIARRVGVPGSATAIDGRNLPTDPDRLAEVVERTSVFGRVTPHQKQAMVAALQRSGHVVAMTGDGVNDVLALKDADIGIAIGSGSQASRAVAQLVLLDGEFASLPGVIDEGRRVIANIERVANLFVTKTIYAVLLAWAIALPVVFGFEARPFPFLPRHLTLVGSLTIGIPAFFLALAPNAKRAKPGFVARVLRFALPTGAAAALATVLGYQVAFTEDVSLTEARTMATIVLVAVGIFALVIVSRPLTAVKRLLIGAMGGILVVGLVIPGFQTFFDLNLPRASVVLAGVGIVAITGSLMYGGLHAAGWLSQVPELIRSASPPTPAANWQDFKERTATTFQALRWGSIRERFQSWGDEDLEPSDAPPDTPVETPRETEWFNPDEEL